MPRLTGSLTSTDLYLASNTVSAYVQKKDQHSTGKQQSFARIYQNAMLFHANIKKLIHLKLDRAKV